MNTLYLQPAGKVLSADTDSLGLEQLTKETVQSSKEQRVLIWGSGVMGKALKGILGECADLFSVRNEKSKEGAIQKDYDLVFWCAGLSADPPNLLSSPRVLIDLDYKESSEAREVALSWGSDYISGEAFFKKQAQAQQDFWLQASKECI